MPRQTEKDRVRRHFERIRAADKVFERWNERFTCDKLLKYYCGEQWDKSSAYVDSLAVRGEKPYTVNLVFPSLQTQLPSLLFNNPTVKIEPRPPFSDEPSSTITQRAKLCEDTVQTFIDDPNVHFQAHTNLGLLEAHFRFAVVEVGHTADWVDNPHAGKPVLNEKNEEVKDGDDYVAQPDLIPESEEMFVKRIPASMYRVSHSSRNVLTENDWVGYWEWQHVEDVKRNRKYKNTATLKSSGTAKDWPTVGEDEEREQHAGMVKLFKLWDLRSKTRCVLADGHEKYLLEGEAFDYLPHAVLKFHEVPDQFYPLPPVFNWTSPQDTVNEVRESRRVHRKRFYRRYTHRKGILAPEELEKLESGGDGVYAEHTGAPNEVPLLPVPDAPLGADTDKDLAEARSDFDQVSGAGAEARGVADSDTATQANIIDVRSRIRESASRAEVKKWLGEIARLMLLTIRDKMQLEMWVKRNADAIAQDPQELIKIVLGYQAITASDLGNGALDVSVDIASMSPVSADQLAQQWNQLLALLTNPALAMLLGMSEPLLRKTLKFYGVTAEGEVAAIRDVLQNMLMVQAAQAQAAAGPAAGGASSSPPATQPGQPAGLPAASSGMVQ